MKVKYYIMSVNKDKEIVEAITETRDKAVDKVVDLYRAYGEIPNYNLEIRERDDDWED